MEGRGQQDANSAGNFTDSGAFTQGNKDTTAVAGSICESAMVPDGGVDRNKSLSPLFCVCVNKASTFD